MKIEEYHALGTARRNKRKHPQLRFSNSQLAQLDRRGPEYFEGAFLADPQPWPVTSTKPQTVGQVFHTMALEGSQLNEVATVVPDDVLTSNGQRRGKKYDAWLDGVHTPYTITAAEEQAVKQMVDAVYRSPAAANLLGLNVIGTETTIFYDHKPSGLKLRARPDLLVGDRGRVIVVDLKSSRAPRPRDWPREVAKWGYHRQAAFYCDAVEALGYDVDCFRFVTVDNEPPYECLVYELPPEDVEQGRSENARLLDELASRLRNDDWRTADGVLQLGLPAWAKERVELIVDGETIEI